MKLELDTYAKVIEDTSKFIEIVKIAKLKSISLSDKRRYENLYQCLVTVNILLKKNIFEFENASILRSHYA